MKKEDKTKAAAKGSNNSSLHAAKAAKNDEFYTQMSDIASELVNYREHFKDKVVLCNCDDPYESNFFKFFALYFNLLGLRKLICTCYDGSPITGTQLDLFAGEPEKKRKAYKMELTEMKDWNGDGAVDLKDVELLLTQNKPELLKGNGDFRSEECVKLLDKADIVVTNPPFSLFRDYVAQLVSKKKKFLILGNMNAITYKEIFPLIKENKLWLGYKFGGMTFSVPDSSGKVTATKSLGNICWFTNLTHKKRNEKMILFKKYNAKEYPKYDNYDAIEVSKVSEIPMDYDGVMGVPITFLDKYCPDQFEIIGMAKRGAGDPALKSKVYTKNDYTNYSDLNAGPTLFDKSGKLHNTFPRVLISKLKDK